MPPRKRKAVQTQAAAKKRRRVQPPEATSSTPPEPEADQANSSMASTTQDQGTVVPSLSSGLKSTISFTSANGESDYDPLPICTFNDLDVFITEATKQKICLEFRVHRPSIVASTKLLS